MLRSAKKTSVIEVARKTTSQVFGALGMMAAILLTPVRLSAKDAATEKVTSEAGPRADLPKRDQAGERKGNASEQEFSGMAIPTSSSQNPGTSDNASVKKAQHSGGQKAARPVL